MARGPTAFDKEGKPIHQNGLPAVQRMDYARSIKGGPWITASNSFLERPRPTTDWLYAYIDGDKIPVPPTRIVDRGPLPKHPYSRDNRPGMIAPDFDLEEVDLVFLEKSQEFLAQHAEDSPDKPFFLFHSMQAVHLRPFR